MSKVKVDIPTGIGPSFSNELTQAELDGLKIAWNKNTVFYYTDEGEGSLDTTQITTLQSIITNHNPTDPKPVSQTKLKRIDIDVYAQYLKTLAANQLRKEAESTEFQTFLDNIIDLGIEGI